MKTQIVSIMSVAALSALLVGGVPVAHLGPGAGSVKSAPFIRIDNAPSTSQSLGAMSFHVSGDQNADAFSTLTLGPGLQSVKGPGVH